MTITDIKRNFITNEHPNLYILFGEEYAVINIYIEKISGAFDSVKDGQTFSAVKKRFTGRSLFQTGKDLYILRDDDELLNSENDWKTLLKRLKENDIYVIAKYGKLDQRSKFYKTFSDNACEFTFMTPDIISKHIKNQIKLADSCCDYLIDAFRCDYGRILLELDKVKHTMEYYNLSPNDAFKLCYNSNVFYEEPEDVLFSLVDSIMTRNVKLSYELLDELKRRGDNPIGALSILHNTVKAVLQVQSLNKKKDITKATGLTQYQVNAAFKYLNRYTDKELIRFMKYLRYCDKSIKDGTIDASMVLDFVFVNIF